MTFFTMGLRVQAWTLLLMGALGSVARGQTTVYVNGNIYTGAQPARVEAMATRGGTILATGTAEAVRKAAGAGAQGVNLHGAFVMPGFNDAHLHLGEGARAKLDVDLVGAKSLDEMLRRISVRAKQARAGEWIVGRGWDHTTWPGQTLPSRGDLDKVTGKNPAVFVRVDGHISAANSAALAAGGVTKATPDPQGGKFDRDTKGEPTGILRETAREMVEGKIPEPTPEQRRYGLELVLREAALYGVTSAQDNSDWQDFLVLEELEREGKLTLRVSEWLPFDLPLELLEKGRAHHATDDPMLHTGMLKGFMDGSLGSRTAAMLAPYADDPKNSGIPRYTQEQLDVKTVERARAGFQVGFHAIGDRGVRMALDSFELAEINVPAAKDRRFRVEHAQVVAPEDFQRFAKLGVIASMQPNHLLTDMNWAESRIGLEREKTSYAWKTFLNAGVKLAFGTDFPVEPITPFRGVYAAVTRMNEAGTKTYQPQEKLSMEQAIAAYTTGAAYAEFADKQKGTLAPGMLADFVVLDRDITKVGPAEVLKTRVLRTVVGGKTVYPSK